MIRKSLQQRSIMNLTTAARNKKQLTISTGLQLPSGVQDGPNLYFITSANLQCMLMQLQIQTLMVLVFNGTLRVWSQGMNKREIIFHTSTGILFHSVIAFHPFQNVLEWFMSLMQVMYTNRTCTRLWHEVSEQQVSSGQHSLHTIRW